LVNHFKSRKIALTNKFQKQYQQALGRKKKKNRVPDDEEVLSIEAYDEAQGLYIWNGLIVTIVDLDIGTLQVEGALGPDEDILPLRADQVQMALQHGMIVSQPDIHLL